MSVRSAIPAMSTVITAAVRYSYSPLAGGASPWSQCSALVAVAAQVKVSDQVLGMNGTLASAGTNRSWASTMNSP